MDLETSKNMGGIGSLLIVIACLGSFGSVYVGTLALVGLILVLIALKGFADFYKEAGIFNNALYALIIAIVGGIVTVGVAIVSVMMWMTSLSGLDLNDPNSIMLYFQTHFMDMSALWELLGIIVAIVITLFIFVVLTVVFFRKSLNLMFTKTGVGMFGTAGLLMLIGAVLTIVLVGLILIWVGFILLIVAFFSVKAQATPPPPQPPA
jgi:uncharacterized membrane protein